MLKAQLVQHGSVLILGVGVSRADGRRRARTYSTIGVDEEHRGERSIKLCCRCFNRLTTSLSHCVVGTVPHKVSDHDVNCKITLRNGSRNVKRTL